MRVRFTAGFLQDESGCLIEQPHGGLPVSSLMSIKSNRWSIRAPRTRGIRLVVCSCLFAVCYFFLRPVRKLNHEHNISGSAIGSPRGSVVCRVNYQTVSENLEGSRSLLIEYKVVDISYTV